MKFALIIASFLFVGASAQDFAPYIIGGESVQIVDAPFMLSLRQHGDHICGAVIISPFWALTAAQCVSSFEGDIKGGLSLRAGSANKDRTGQVHNINTVKVHDKYDPETYQFDFALLKVANPLSSFDNKVKPVDLPACWTEPRPYSSAQILGWGSTGYDENPKTLQSAEVQIVNRARCNTLRMGHQTIEATGYGTMICAIGYNKGTCKGDEGGPLMAGNLLLGITSWGIGCADNDYPGVFGNVGNYYVRIWISNTTGK